jgi:hypothetical protein
MKDEKKAIKKPNSPLPFFIPHPSSLILPMGGDRPADRQSESSSYWEDCVWRRDTELRG